jgi:hypothetical protein
VDGRGLKVRTATPDGEGLDFNDILAVPAAPEVDAHAGFTLSDEQPEAASDNGGNPERIPR